MTDFIRYCVQCRNEVPDERLRRGADTCSVECKKQDRKAQRRAQKAWILERLVKTPAARKLVKTYEQDKKRSAPATIHPPVETPIEALCDRGSDGALGEGTISVPGGGKNGA